MSVGNPQYILEKVSEIPPLTNRNRSYGSAIVKEFLAKATKGGETYRVKSTQGTKTKSLYNILCRAVKRERVDNVMLIHVRGEEVFLVRLKPEAR